MVFHISHSKLTASPILYTSLPRSQKTSRKVRTYLEPIVLRVPPAVSINGQASNIAIIQRNLITAPVTPKSVNNESRYLCIRECSFMRYRLHTFVWLRSPPIFMVRGYSTATMDCRLLVMIQSFLRLSTIRLPGHLMSRSNLSPGSFRSLQNLGRATQWDRQSHVDCTVRII